MAQNLTDEFRKFRYYEGVCSSSDFLKELAQVLSLGVKSEAVKDIDGNIIQEATPYKVKNWDIVYPLVSKDFNTGNEKIILTDRDNYLDEDYGVDALDPELRIAKLKNQIAQIKDKVVLRTKTSPKTIEESEVDDLSVSEEKEQASTTMYVQFWKPKYIANPEEYPLDAELHGLTPQLITKEMYRDARKTTASVIYDLAKLEGNGYNSESTRGLVTKQASVKRVDAVSEAYTRDYLFDQNVGVLNGLTAIYGAATLDEVIEEPTESNRSTSFTIPRAYLNSIKQTNLSLYQFIFDICGLHSSFTSSDYDLIDEMKMMITASGTTGSLKYYVILTFSKNVEIFTIAPNIGTVDETTGNVIESQTLLVEEEYGHAGLDNLQPELYSEGRYVPLPEKYISDPAQHYVTFKKPVRFCLDKIVDSDSEDDDNKIFHGTVVLRYNYDKKMEYTDLSSLRITDSVALENNHYCLVRMFDNPNIDFSGPEPNIQDAKGNVTVTNSHSSPWSKLSWYQDFEEIMMDDIDEDVSVTSVTDGTLLVPLETAGLTSDTRISYWINTNNDRFSLIVMGNPALDYQRDRHLISSCYCGRIESFENSINDVSGNFALYTSSSTTPCKTVMTAHDTQYHINRDFQNDHFIENAIGLAEDDDKTIAAKYPTATGRESNIEEYKAYCKTINGVQEYSKIKSDGFDIYYITLTGNKFFNESEVPCYMILNSDNEPQMLTMEKDGKDDSGKDVMKPVYYKQVAYFDFIYGSSDSRSNQIKIYIPSLKNVNSNNLKVYFNFGYYEEKFVINSGITRDVFGNVIGIETIDDYGKNTSDGVTSVSMYHTRSKAFYQKHHFLFATTEEYMSKVMYGKSSYTGEYYADRIKITHGNDGPRGILSDTLVIDNSSLYPKDELVINKDFAKGRDELEETFTYFPITAPFSPLADGPNARYGIALKKAEREPAYTDNKKILNIARDELDVKMNDYAVVKEDIVLPSQTTNGCKIYWEVLPDSNWFETESGKQIICHFPNDTKVFTGYRYTANNVDIVVDGFKLGSDPEAVAPTTVSFDISKAVGKKTVDFLSTVKLKPTNNTYELPNSVDNVLYGYSDEQLRNITGNTNLTYIIDDGTNTGNIHEYAYKECFVDITNPIDIDDIATNGSITNQFEQEIFNAHPTKYLNIFFTEPGAEAIATRQVEGQENGEDVFNKVIKSYVSIPLCNTTWREDEYDADHALFGLLQYPCTITAYTTGVTNSNEQGIVENSALYNRYEFNYKPFAEEVIIKTQNMSGDASLMTANHSVKETIESVDGKIIIPAAKLLDDIYINVSRV